MTTTTPRPYSRPELAAPVTAACFVAGYGPDRAQRLTRHADPVLRLAVIDCSLLPQAVL